ncbi:outer membrane beta-barrel protein [Hydrogenothermus marinus]|uniref:Putative OmpL-like beta-barrel porin-2 n=1 Tax=Hydrogenothermus marinus TaxID=133270 RepID=A0A3M0BIY1_9AQUI|nr:outer membrane beta-barrel protein [Hydrogenothermus marinus]RMA97107.1 putative OmpL-like beta-barrel porin-2 [Hydrogenothermus marinus]
MKKVLGLAAAGLVAAGAANAGTLTVANTDITLYGGVSASYDYMDNDHVAAQNNVAGNQDNFHVTTFAIGLMKKADPNKSPIGFNAAFASFDIPTVIASGKVVNDNNLIKYGQTSEFKPWLAYATIAPIEGLSIDAGLLWNKFGEAPLTILNKNYTRGILFTGHPVLYPGARVNYDAGIAKVYVGYNQGGGLRQGNVKDAVEAGVMADLGVAKVGLHMYDESAGRNLYVACAKADAGVAKVGVEIDYTTLDDNAKTPGADDSALGIALNVDPVINEQVSVPVRIEYVNNGDSAPGDISGSGIYLTGEKSAWSFTITPTYKPTKNTFARVEAAYVTTDKKVFVNDKGNGKDSRTVLAFEAGFLF